MPRLAALFLAAVTAAAAQTPQPEALAAPAAWTEHRKAAPAAPAPPRIDPDQPVAPKETHRARFRRRTKAVATVALGVAVVTAYIVLKAYAGN
jgi:hypothetical protein